MPIFPSYVLKLCLALLGFLPFRHMLNPSTKRHYITCNTPPPPLCATPRYMPSFPTYNPVVQFSRSFLRSPHANLFPTLSCLATALFVRAARALGAGAGSEG